jgi:hypothetical protein
MPVEGHSREEADMRRTIPRMALVLLVGWAGLAAAAIVVRVGPPAPRHEVIAVSPGPGHIWVGGYWRWDRVKHAWMGGKWIPGRAGYAWVPGHWKQVPGGWEWVEGRWRKH